MFCENCGAVIPASAKLCPECGARVFGEITTAEIPEIKTEVEKKPDVPNEKKPRKKKDPYVQNGKVKGEKVTENIYLCPDGVYRWFYEMDMLKNPTILFTVWKVLGISFGVVGLFILAVDLFDGMIHSFSDIVDALQVLLIFIPVIFVLSIIAYVIVAWTFGWKYIVLFEMTDEYVKHIPTPKQFEKAQALNWLTVVAGTLAHKPTVMGAGMLAGAKSVSTSVFREVKFIRVRRKRNTIHVDQLLDKNQVYAEDADFDFVEKFITERCVKAMIK